MGYHVQLDLKAIEQAPAVSRAAGVTLEQHLAGLVLMIHHIFAKKSDRATQQLLMGWFGVPSSAIPRLVDALISFGHLSTTERDRRTAVPDGVWRIKGAHRYEKLREGLSKGGHAAKGNLRQFAERAERAPGAEEAGPQGPVEPDSSGPARGRGLSDKEECWENLERARVEHCERLGLSPGRCQRPKLCNKKVGDAIRDAGIADDNIIGGQHLTACDYLCVLFEQYLLDELGRVDTKTGALREPPWPVPLFLHPNVLERFKRNFEAAA